MLLFNVLYAAYNCFYKKLILLTLFKSADFAVGFINVCNNHS